MPFYEGRSAAGRRVTLTLDCGSYFGAKPYYTVAYYQTNGTATQRQLYTPFEARARHYLAGMLRDVTDVADLCAVAPVCRPEEAARLAQATGRRTIGRPGTPSQGGGA